MSKQPPAVAPTKTAPATPGKAKKPDPPEKQTSHDVEGGLRSHGPAFAADPPPLNRGFVSGLNRLATVQAKPKVGRRGDRFEDEADRVADSFVASENTPGPLIARKPAGISYGVLPSRTSAGAKGRDPGGGEVDDDTHSVIESSRGRGEALPADVQGKMGEHMGADFSGVRVHSGPEADRATKNIGAQAFTTGSDIYFGSGKYQPGSTEGKRLLAHEMTHVVQQGAAKPVGASSGASLQAKPRPKARVEGRVQAKRIQRFEFSFAGAKEGLNKVGGAIKGVASKIGGAFTGAISGKVDSLANNIPGYRLLKFALGFSPITGKKVQRTPTNFVGALLTFFGPAGNLLFTRLKKVKAVERTFAWVLSRIKRFNLTGARAKRMFKTVKDRFPTVPTPGKVIRVFKLVFRPLFRDVKRFTRAAVWKVKELIFNGFLKLVGGNKGPIGKLIARAKPVIRKIWNNPVAFANNVFRGVKMGVQGFLGNIGTHLKKGFMEWLFGSVGRAGITFPNELSFKGVASVVMQIAGLTYANFRVRAVKKFGEKVVGVAEKGVAIFKLLREKGPLGIYEQIKENVNGIIQQALAAAKKALIIQVIKAGILWIIGLLNPASAIVKVLKGLVDVVFFVIQRAKQLIEFGNALLSSVVAIAKGDVKAVAKKVEFAFARAVPVAIGMLASVLGVGGFAAKLQNIFQKFQKPINRVIDKVLNKARGLVAKFFKRKGKGKGKGKGGGAISLSSMRASFSMAGKPHTLSVKKRGGSVKLIMASSRPQPLSVKVDNALQQLAKPEVNEKFKDKAGFIKGRLNTFKRFATSYEREVNSAMKNRRKKNNKGEIQKFVSKLRRLGGLIGKFAARMGLQDLGLEGGGVTRSRQVSQATSEARKIVKSNQGRVSVEILKQKLLRELKPKYSWIRKFTSTPTDSGRHQIIMRKPVRVADDFVGGTIPQYILDEYATVLQDIADLRHLVIKGRDLERRGFEDQDPGAARDALLEDNKRLIDDKSTQKAHVLTRLAELKSELDRVGLRGSSLYTRIEKTHQPRVARM